MCNTSFRGCVFEDALGGDVVVRRRITLVEYGQELPFYLWMKQWLGLEMSPSMSPLNGDIYSLIADDWEPGDISTLQPRSRTYNTGATRTSEITLSR